MLAGNYRCKGKAVTVFLCCCSVSALCTYNVLAKYRPDDRWQKRLVLISKLLGCYRVIQTAQLDEM
jgi:hypothetical protein